MQGAWQAGKMLYIATYILKWPYDAWKHNMKYYDSDDNKE